MECREVPRRDPILRHVIWVKFSSQKKGLQEVNRTRECSYLLSSLLDCDRVFDDAGPICLLALFLCNEMGSVDLGPIVGGFDVGLDGVLDGNSGQAEESQKENS